jgi:nicotinate-nucleotide--dimethylbenzimidazole phosphoribosyltransferase
MQLPSIRPLDSQWFRRAAEHQARLTMPAGALGRVLELGRQLCAVQETLRPCAEPSAVIVMAADHGIAEEGVSAYPQEVTSQMVANFLRGGAAINVLSRRHDYRVLVVNMGVKEASRLPPSGTRDDWIADGAVGPGTRNFLKEPAMTGAQVAQALATGRRIVEERLQGVRIVALGEMGIGNSTCASALTAALLGLPPASVTGRGTGLDDAGWRHKVDCIERALARHFPDSSRRQPATEEVLPAVGGFEILGLAGVALEAAARKMLVVLDGFISSVAGLVAFFLEPAVREYLVTAHRSQEVGHRVVLEKLELAPLLDLGLRLGEGSGAALAMPLIQSAADIMCDMATFEEAGVSERQ